MLEQIYLFSVVCLLDMNNTRKHMTEDLHDSQGKTSTYTRPENYLFSILFHTLKICLESSIVTSKLL